MTNIWRYYSFLVPPSFPPPLSSPVPSCCHLDQRELESVAAPLPPPPTQQEEEEPAAAGRRGLEMGKFTIARKID